MKIKLFALIVLILATSVNAYTIRPVVVRYAIYMIGTENNKSSYVFSSFQPNHQFTNVLDVRLNWFKVWAGTDGVVNDAEFDVAFAFYNTVNPGAGLLKDEATDVVGGLDLFNKQ